MIMSRKTTITGFLLLVVFLVGLWIGPGKPLARSQSPANTKVSTSVGSLAPDIMFSELEGEQFRLSDFRGKVVMINLFASWCGPCILETPHLVEFFKENHEEVMVIGLNFGERREAIENYRDRFEVNYPLIFDLNGSIGEIYRGFGLPTSWFIDSEGVIRHIQVGPMTSDFILKVVQDIKDG